MDNDKCTKAWYLFRRIDALKRSRDQVEPYISNDWQLTPECFKRIKEAIKQDIDQQISEAQAEVDAI